MNPKIPRKPEWLRVSLPGSGAFAEVKKHLSKEHLSTVCVEASCPNLAECWGRGTMTIMILGDVCTRRCKFCNVNTGKPLPPNPREPAKVARILQSLNIKHGVVTSVTRDDLPDEGAAHWAKVIYAVKKKDITIEVLVPDFNGRTELLDIVLKAKPHIFAHNLETVKRLTPLIRSKADYERSLFVLKYANKSGMLVKSGLMLGMGETEDEIIEALQDMYKNGVHIVTMGQYLMPTRKHWQVEKYLTPEEFAYYKNIALEIGFKAVESAPLVRSSYHADEQVKLLKEF